MMIKYMITLSIMVNGIAYIGVVQHVSKLTFAILSLWGAHWPSG